MSEYQPEESRGASELEAQRLPWQMTVRLAHRRALERQRDEDEGPSTSAGRDFKTPA